MKIFWSHSERLSCVEAYLKEHYVEPVQSHDYVRFSITPSSSVRFSSRLLDSQMQHLHSVVKAREETFSQALIRLIRESGMTHPECYQRALVSKQHFSKIQSDTDYQPTRGTVFAFAIALSLPLDQAEKLLKKAGFAFSNSRRSDLIVKFAITHGIYDLMKVNELLDHYHEKLLP